VATSARHLAHGVLLQVERGRSTLAELLAAPDIERLDPRERAFLHELVLGSLRHRGALDHALAQLSDRPLDRLDPGVLAALRLGAYQVLRLRVPARAAVSEAVELARQAQPRASGFVNAVLRRLVREGPPSVPNPESDPLGWLTTEGSLPQWLAARWLSRFGSAAAVARARAFLEPPPTVFRLNPRIPDALDRARQAGLEPQGLLVPGAFEAAAGRATELAGAGVLYLQDQGSQLVGHLAAASGRILDACAAPGGKTTLLADAVPRPGLVVAAEASPRRLQTLAALVRRWGSPGVCCVGADGTRPPFHGATFDAVLLDAPCTGLGTLARHPDIRWRVGPEDLTRHAQRQRALLDSLAELVAPGGRLVYSTCSAEPEESEDVVRPFLNSHAAFTTAAPPDWATPFRDGPFLRTQPERDHGDAFFAALLQRTARE
jgi:16S rRNA (cytosine967-C5)-methyltransferase